jgi:acyl carrier protein
LALPDTTAGQYAAVVQIDSLCAVELLCEVEPIIGFELKDSIVRSGGYRSINEAISHVMPRIEAAWHKHAKKGAKK